MFRLKEFEIKMAPQNSYCIASNTVNKKQLQFQDGNLTTDDISRYTVVGFRAIGRALIPVLIREEIISWDFDQCQPSIVRNLESYDR